MTKPNDKDVMPELDDDVEMNSASDVDDGGNEPAPQQRAAPEKPESPREAAVRRYRELRDQARNKAEDDDSDAAGDDDTSDPEPAAPAARAARAENPAPAAANDTALDATRSLLEETKALLAEARTMRTQPRATEADNDDDLDADDAPAESKAKATDIDDARLEDIVERIQIGDKSEGRQALADLIEVLGASKVGAMKPDDIGRVVQEQIARDRITSEIADATTTFRTKYTGLVEDPDLLESSLRRLNAEMRDDLIKAGAKADDLARASPDQLMVMHQQARMSGQKVRTYNDLFEKVGTDVVKKFGAVLPAAPRQAQQPSPTPAASNAIADRMDRKRNASVQPRAAGMRVNTEPQVRPKTRADVINEMRRQRGFKG